MDMNAARLPHENFEEYKLRRSVINALTKEALRPKLFHQSVWYSSRVNDKGVTHYDRHPVTYNKKEGPWIHPEELK